MKEDVRVSRILVNFFDRLEDGIRARLSRYPLVYAIVGGTGTVLFWRGIWHTADLFEARLAEIGSPWAVLFSGPGTMFVGLIILLMTGLMVSVFIGDQIILSGIKREKKLAEKTEIEVRGESNILADLREEIHHLEEAFGTTVGGKENGKEKKEIQ